MKKNSSILNKYTLSLFILLLCLGVDIILHKGMSRVMLPASFTINRNPQNIPRCDNPLLVTDKKWKKAVNTVSLMEGLPADVAGIEMDVYFDTAKNVLLAYHDSSQQNHPLVEDILNVYQNRKLTASIWLDFKNLTPLNEKQSLAYLSLFRQRYQLHNKIIIESYQPQCLRSFCDSGFFTCYYTPFFNPYQLNQKELAATVDTIANNLIKYPAGALSGYYFQYPLFKKFFPNYPVLIWAQKDKFSFISTAFNYSITSDPQVKIVLYP